jgi:DNA invertase Pin-like site-specific DNA recombinase
VLGTRTSSPALTELLAVREGDVVIVNRLARLGRNTVHTVQLIAEFNRRSGHFRALDLGIDSRTPVGQLVSGVFARQLQAIRARKQLAAELGRY